MKGKSTMVNTDIQRKLEKIRVLVGEHQRLVHINVALQLQHTSKGYQSQPEDNEHPPYGGSAQADTAT